jgi:squalene synthase HpnC
MSTEFSKWRSGKSHGDENFPVASRLVRARHRPAILVFYNFVRTADDVADHPELPAAKKLSLIDELEAGLLGDGTGPREALALRDILAAHRVTPRHAQDLLQAFRQDAVKHRYKDWPELVHYCRYSAMPVGRFVLDLHGEDASCWAASDALCATLQIINHLQDCGSDFRNLDRVYLPADALAAAGAQIPELRASHASPALLDCLRAIAARTQVLFSEAEPLAAQIKDTRLALEIAAIHALAHRLICRLMTQDPLSGGGRLRRREYVFGVMTGIASGLWRRSPMSGLTSSTSMRYGP